VIEMAASDIDGRFGQGWGGLGANGVHVNVMLAARGSPSAAAIVTAFTTPSAGVTPILVCVGADQPSYEIVYPPTIMLTKAPVAGPWHQRMLFGPTQVGIARGVLDCVADGLLVADQDSIVLVSVWLEATAQDAAAVRRSAREATARGVGEAVRGRGASDVERLVRTRDELTHPFDTA
jgi:formaldehyde-activating enzyme